MSNYEGGLEIMLTNDTAKVMMVTTTRTSKKNHYNVTFLHGKFYG